jgi:hypothetical protein
MKETPPFDSISSTRTADLCRAIPRRVSARGCRSGGSVWQDANGLSKEVRSNESPIGYSPAPVLCLWVDQGSVREDDIDRFDRTLFSIDQDYCEMIVVLEIELGTRDFQHCESCFFYNEVQNPFSSKDSISPKK